MTAIVDCANDEAIATNLKEYLSAHGYEARKDDSLDPLQEGDKFGVGFS